MSQIPDGWTDDMNITLPPEHTLEDIVKFVIAASRNGHVFDTIESALVQTHQLSAGDAALAVDRVHGGVVRAATGNVANCPDESKDPLAWLSFQWAMQDASIVADLYPQDASTQAAEPTVDRHKPWWRFWR